MSFKMDQSCINHLLLFSYFIQLCEDINFKSSGYLSRSLVGMSVGMRMSMGMLLLLLLDLGRTHLRDLRLGT